MISVRPSRGRGSSVAAPGAFNLVVLGRVDLFSKSEPGGFCFGVSISKGGYLLPCDQWPVGFEQRTRVG